VRRSVQFRIPLRIHLIRLSTMPPKKVKSETEGENPKKSKGDKKIQESKGDKKIQEDTGKKKSRRYWKG